MLKYLAPLGIFVGGNIALLLVFLFLGAVGDAADQLASDTSAMASTFWNWDLVSGTTVKFLVFFMFEGAILWAVGKSFLKVR